MKIFKATILVLLLGAALAFGGCGGGDTQVKASSTTMGQELQDLKKAFDEGIITEKEYNNAKKEILKKYD